MNGRYDSIGASLTFSDTEAGTPIVFLHPTPIDREYWRPLIGELEGVRAIVPDLRGHGQSELGKGLPVGAFGRVPDAPVVTIAQLANDVLALLQYCSIPKADFVGCSIGGYVLLELWRKAPEQIRSLAFVCSKPQADAEGNLTKRAKTIAQASAGDTEALFDGMAQTLIGATARARRPAIVEELRARMMLTQDALVAVQAGLATRPDSVATVNTIEVPVLAVAGGEDSAVTPAEMEAFRAASGGCKYYLLPDAGHFAAYEQPEKVAALLSDWLHRLEEN
jgi:3-oxoadipate enol-lactonase